jgi:integrase
MKRSISIDVVQSAELRKKPYDIRDTRVKGFLLRVQPSGVKTYYVEYARGKRKKLGRADALKPDEARIEARKVLGAACKGEDPEADDRKKMTKSLETFMDKVYEPWAIVNLKHGKLASDRVRRNFGKFLKRPMLEITVFDIDRWRTKRRKLGRKSSTLNRDINGLKAVYNRAVRWKFLDVNPIVDVKLDRVDPIARCRFLNDEEFEALRNALDVREERICSERKSANKWRAERGYELLPELSGLPFADHLKPMVLISLGTGMRRGELFSLTWQNVDMSRAQITVIAETAKTGKTRYIPMNSEVHQVLSDWKAQTEGKSGLVFVGKNGGKFDNVKRSWEQVLKDAEIEDFRWHDMRHTFASRLTMANVDLNTVRELLGHADYNMTLRYAHLAPSHKAAAVERLVRGQHETNSANIVPLELAKVRADT